MLTEKDFLEEERLLRSLSEDGSINPPKRRWWQICSLRTFLSCLATGLLAMILLAVVVVLATLPQKSTTTSPETTTAPLHGFDPATHENPITSPSCGTTPAEALAAGCVFDVMNYAWTPPSCFDPVASAEALSRGPWNWYYDKNATQIIPGGQNLTLLSLETEVWTEHSYHVAHCLYALKLVHRAAMSGGELLREVGSWNHTLHCDDLLQETGTEGGVVNTWVRTIFNPCVRFGRGKM